MKQAVRRRATGSPRVSPPPIRPDARAVLARRWLLLAVGALAASGLLAILVVAGRIPALAPHWVGPEMANRLLVVHVDLGVVVWFGALPVALFHLHALARGAGGPARLARWAPATAGLGALLLLSGLIPGLGTPRPVNYIPVVTHPLYALGLLLFMAGVAVSYLDGHLVGRAADPVKRSRPAGVGSERASPVPRTSAVRALARSTAAGERAFLPEPVAQTLATCGPLVRVGALYFLVALAALAVAFVRLPDWLEGDVRMEVLMWGGGHVLQFTNVAFALVAWALLASWWSGRPLSGKGAVRWSALALSVSLVPILFLLAMEPGSAQYRAGFTSLMRWGLFPPVLLFLGLGLRPHWRAREGARGPSSSPGDSTPGAGLALFASVVLMLAGFLFGAFIRGSDLRIPGHYHACIGSVTLAYMALTLLIPWKGTRSLHHRPGSTGRRVGRPGALLLVGALYGAGQLVFSSGLFVAGSYGLGRKLYGMEQEVLNAGQGVGLAVMAVGGTLALMGGLVWAVAALRCSAGAD